MGAENHNEIQTARLTFYCFPLCRIVASFGEAGHRAASAAAETRQGELTAALGAAEKRASAAAAEARAERERCDAEISRFAERLNDAREALSAAKAQARVWGGWQGGKLEWIFAGVFTVDCFDGSVCTERWRFFGVKRTAAPKAASRRYDDVSS